MTVYSDRPISLGALASISLMEPVVVIPEASVGDVLERMADLVEVNTVTGFQAFGRLWAKRVPEGCEAMPGALYGVRLMRLVSVPACSPTPPCSPRTPR